MADQSSWRSETDTLSRPWNAVYVKLVPKVHADNAWDEERGQKKRRKKKKLEEILTGIPVFAEGEVDNSPTSDDLTTIPPSRTFLAAFSSKSMCVRWCKSIAYQNEESPPSEEIAQESQVGDDIQTQLWHAFHAGVTWGRQQAAAEAQAAEAQARAQAAQFPLGMVPGQHIFHLLSNNPNLRGEPYDYGDGQSFSDRQG